MISIIIPALNEEKYLPNLLNSIKSQDFNDYEIILADGGSKDSTVKIAKSYGCHVVKGGLPARGRNEGAKIAKGDLLFFLDADSLLPEINILSKSIEEFKKRKLGLASFKLLTISKSKVSNSLLNFFYNNPINFLEKILPHAAMGILVDKNIFQIVGGFDESVKLAEDHYFVRQAIKITKVKFGIIKSANLFVSDRRFKTDGWISTGIKFFLCELHMIFIGPVRSDIFKYKFDHYSKPKK